MSVSSVTTGTLAARPRPFLRFETVFPSRRARVQVERVESFLHPFPSLVGGCRETAGEHVPLILFKARITLNPIHPLGDLFIHT